jgi:CheY-like chemotaxis protein
MHASGDGPAIPGKRPHILCLDDQRENLRLRKLFLELFWCQVTAVEDAETCLCTARKAAFDLGLLDYHLGGEITGEHVALELRVHLPHMPLIMLTGDPKIPDSARQSVDAVLVKGLSNPIELLDTIQELLPDCILKPRRKAPAASVLSKTPGW